MGELRDRIKGLRDNQKVNYAKLNSSTSPPVLTVPSSDPQIVPKPEVVLPDRLTDLNKKLDQLNQLAYHDELTGLPNRRLFQEELARNLDLSIRFKLQLAVIFLDMDKFKQINDTFGHDAGDALLREVSVRMRRTLGAPAVNARLGGDEFTTLLPSIANKQEVELSAISLLHSLQPPFNVLVNGEQLALNSTPSIGISLYPDHGCTAKDLMKAADLAMYQIKQNGKNNFGFYCGS